jgi:hypothetical protein
VKKSTWCFAAPDFMLMMISQIITCAGFHCPQPRVLAHDLQHSGFVEGILWKPKAAFQHRADH